MTITISFGVATFANCVHFRANVFEVKRTHAFPRCRVVFEHEVQQLADDALLGLRELAAFHARVETAVAAEEVIDDEEHQVRIEHEQRRAAQRLDVDEVQVRRDRQVAGEFAVLLHLHRTDRDFRRAPHEVEDAHAQEAREAVVDDFQARHPAPDDAFLRREVVGAHAVEACFVGDCVDFPGDALEQGVHLLLRHELFVAHECSLVPVRGCLMFGGRASCSWLERLLLRKRLKARVAARIIERRIP